MDFTLRSITTKEHKMTQQEAMEKILWEWIITDNNLTQLERTLGKGWVATESARKRKNTLEHILKCNGFVYRIITEGKEGEYTTHYMFRKKKAKNFIKIHENWLNKNIGHEWYRSEIKWMEFV